MPADEEYALFLRYTGLDPDELIRVRLEAGPMPRLDLDELSGIFVGGGPFNASDPLEKKSAVQHRVEAEFATLLDEVVARDFPFLGACYGIGTLGAHQGATIDRTYPEPISVVPVTLTDGRGIRSSAERDAAHLRGLRRPQGGDLGAAAVGGAAGVVARLPGADVPRRRRTSTRRSSTPSSMSTASRPASTRTPTTATSPPTSSS